MFKEIQQDLKFWQVKTRINSFKCKTLIVLAANELDAISDMIEYMAEEGFNRYDLWQHSYKVSQI